MKTHQYSLLKLLVLVIAGSLATSATTRAGASANDYEVDVGGGNASLSVFRVADFGTSIYLNLYIDGVQVTTLGLNQGYKAIVRPGTHVISVGTTPSPYGKTKFSVHRINFKHGQNYAYTAFWEDADHVVLETGAAAALRARQVRW